MVEYYINRVPANGGSAVATVTLTSPIITIVQDVDSTFFVFTGDSMLHRFGWDLTPLSASGHTLGVVHTAVAMQAGDVVVSSTAAGVHYLTRLSSAGTVIGSQAVSTGLTKLREYGSGQVAGFSKTHLITFSSNLAEVSKVAFAGSQDMIVRNNSFRIITGSAHAEFDTLLAVVATHTSNSVDISNRYIASFGNKLAILSEGETHQFSTPNHSKQYFSVINVIDPDSDIVYSSDTHFEDLTVVDTYTSTYGPPGLSSKVHTKFSVQIKNVGTKPMTSVTVNGFMYPNVACGSHYFQEKIPNLLVQPGQSTVVTLNQYFDSFGDGSSSVTQQFCLYTSLPNGEADKVLADNDVCKTFTLVFTSVSEHEGLAAMSVYPNPTRGVARFESSVPVKKIEIFTVDGRIVHSEQPGIARGEINCGELNAGIYFVRFSAENATVVRRLVKN